MTDPKRSVAAAACALAVWLLPATAQQPERSTKELIADLTGLPGVDRGFRPEARPRTDHTTRAVVGRRRLAVVAGGVQRGVDIPPGAAGRRADGDSRSERHERRRRPQLHARHAPRPEGHDADGTRPIPEVDTTTADAAGPDTTVIEPARVTPGAANPRLAPGT